MDIKKDNKLIFDILGISNNYLPSRFECFSHHSQNQTCHQYRWYDEYLNPVIRDGSFRLKKDGKSN